MMSCTILPAKVSSKPVNPLNALFYSHGVFSVWSIDRWPSTDKSYLGRVTRKEISEVGMNDDVHQCVCCVLLVYGQALFPSPCLFALAYLQFLPSVTPPPPSLSLSLSFSLSPILFCCLTLLSCCFFFLTREYIATVVNEDSAPTSTVVEDITPAQADVIRKQMRQV